MLLTHSHVHTNHLDRGRIDVRHLTLCIGVLALTTLPGTATTAKAESTARPEAPSVSAPRLLHEVPMPWPASEPPRANTAVVVEFTVGTDGRVANASIVQSAGAAFDAAALEAVTQFEFVPAARGDETVAARIRYRCVFEPVTDGASASAKGPPAVVAEATQAQAAQPPRSDSTTTDVPVPSTSDTQTSDPPAHADAEPEEEDSYGAVASIDAPPREVTRRSLESKDLIQIPGTSGDALRAIEVMPGVARTSIASGDPILRGAAWNESQSLIEGTKVPLLYHFGGVKSAFNSRLLSRVDLFPGNYGVSLGRAVGGVISAKARDPQTDRFHALAEASVIDSMALVETPIGKNAAVALAGRRSNIDLFYNAFAPKSGFNVVAAPVYYDFQGLATFKLNERHQLRLLTYGSRDALKLVFNNPSDFDPALRDSADFTIAYYRAQAALESHWSARTSQRIQVTYGYTTLRQMLGSARAELRQHDLMSRGEWSYRSSDALRTNVGFDIEASDMQGYYIGARPPQAEGEVMNGGASTEAIVDLSDLQRIDTVRPAMFADLEWRVTSRLLLVPGTRVDYYSDTRAFTVDPRLSARYDLTDRFALKWGLGLYSQNPQYYELIRNFGNPNLKPYHAFQYSAGFEHRPNEALSWGIEGFYKWLYHRVVSTPGGQQPAFLNHGVGRIYGAEFFARYSGTRLRAWLAYTLSRSERQDRTDPWRLFEKDQTHVLAATTSYDCGRGWEIGARFRITSGNPYTPVRSSMFDATAGAYLPINSSPFSARNPTFHQLDVRIEKVWQFTPLKLAAYLDVQNVYNAKNAENFDYSYDFKRRQAIAGLPLTPNLGLRGEL
jgi:TonB family protein